MTDSSAAVADLSTAGWNFDNTYTRLPETLFTRATPARVADPQLSIVNHQLASDLGLHFEHLQESTLASLFAGQTLPAGADPIAQAYAGHQFGGFTMLGDGRAILLGEQRAPDGGLWDLQFKGSGRTAYSRQGDGRAALGPMLREYLISEAMHALGIPTTRSLAVVATGEPVYRETPLPGAILTRVASSHIRVGTFQLLAARRDQDALRQLADYTIARHAPDCGREDKPYLAFLRSVCSKQAQLIATWQLVGFIHGVMNTDNMAISGETIDYGPCAFMDTFDPRTVFSSIDHGGRYAYGNQPAIGQWNLARFAETLLPLLDNDHEKAVELATDVLNEYPAIFESHWLAGMRRKLGLATDEDEDRTLIETLLDWMESRKADFTNLFDDLSTGEYRKQEMATDSEFQTWEAAWRSRLLREGQSPESVSGAMLAANPAVIPRNHRVESALTAAAEDADLSELEQLLAVLSKPFERGSETTKYRSPPPPEFGCYRTFCGT